MDLNRIGKFIKEKRKEAGMTQEDLACKLFVTEKAISRWETGRGTPDISLLVPLAKELKVDVEDILGSESKKSNIERVIEYNEASKILKYDSKFKLATLCYILSGVVFLFYLKSEYDPGIEVNFFVRLIMVTVASAFIIFGNKIISDCCVEKLENKKKVDKFSIIIVFIFYVILMFNMVFFARYTYIDSYNIIPFKSISEVVLNGDFYQILINIFGNFFMFMPLEFFLLELFNLKKFSSNMSASLLCILSIEAFQYIFKIGVADIDDILLCIVGMMSFYFLYCKIHK